MLQFPIHWPLPSTDFVDHIDERNRKIWKLHLNNEWTIMHVVHDSGLAYRIISSIEIHRKNTTGKVLVSGELKLELQSPGIQVWEKKFSQFVDVGTSFIEICSHIDSKFIIGGLYDLYGYVNIQEINAQQVNGVTNGESKERILLNSLKELSNDFERLLDPNSSCFTDVILKCDGASFPAHKFILSTRSPVFEAMFSTPMLESRQNEVDIDDIEAPILRALLTYMYTGKTPDLSASLAAELMFAADKYQLQDLKTVCSYFLKDNVSLQNVVRILVVGDLHSEDLKSFAMEYISNTRAEFSVLEKSEEWITLEKERPALAMEVLTSLVKSRDQKSRRPRNRRVTVY